MDRFKQLRPKLKLCIFLSVLSLSILFSSLPRAPGEVKAQDMSSPNYKLEGGNFNTAAGTGSSRGYRLSDLVGQTAAQIFTSKGYLIQSGFLNKASLEPFTFTISPTRVDFGNLTPNKPTVKSLMLTVSTADFPGYSVYVTQNNPLSTDSGAEIPDTVCDASENKICSVDKPNLWTSDTSYGFGYHLSGQTVSNDNNSDNFFRPFASLSKKEQAVMIMESQEKKVTHTAAMQLKINVSPDQPVGIYQNVLVFSALPGI